MKPASPRTLTISAGQFLVVVHADGEEAGVQSLLERIGGSEIRCLRA